MHVRAEGRERVVTYTNDKVQIGQIGINVRQAIVVDKNVKHTVQVQEQKTVGEPIVQTQEDDNGFRDHDAQGHGCDKTHLLDDVNLLLGNGDLVGVLQVVFPHGARNYDPGQRLRQETHAHGKGGADDDVYPKDPWQAHIDIVGDPLADGRANRGPRVGRGDKQRHGLTGAVRVPK